MTTQHRHVTRRDRQKNAPAAFLDGPRPAGPVVVCAGDSITAGEVSADWVGRLRDRFGPRGWAFVNAGVNSDLAWNLRHRLDEIVACRPDAVVVFIGTNDVAGTLNDATETQYRRDRGIPQTPTREWYVENLDAILARLRSETTARIAVVELPPLGERLDEEMNRRLVAYNAALREVAARSAVEVLPLYERLAALIPPGHAPEPYEHKAGPMLRAAFDHVVRHKSWDEISHRNGLVILTDWIHLNDTAAEVVAELVGDFLDRAEYAAEGRNPLPDPAEGA